MNKVLVSQKAPNNLEPFEVLSDKYKVEFTYRPFFSIEPVESLEFRAQRIDVLSHSAIVFTSKSSIDGFFAVCEEHRVKIPETMKYFCTTELIANYLQKHIVYRKRKIFFGTGSLDSIFTAIGTKHAGENFLVVCCNNTDTAVVHAFEAKGLKHTAGVFVKTVSLPLSDLNLSDYGIVVLYNAADVASIKSNFPEWEQGSCKIIAYGKGVVKPIEEAGFTIALTAPTPEINSTPAAVESLLKKK